MSGPQERWFWLRAWRDHGTSSSPSRSLSPGGSLGPDLAAGSRSSQSEGRSLPRGGRAQGPQPWLPRVSSDALPTPTIQCAVPRDMAFCARVPPLGDGGWLSPGPVWTRLPACGKPESQNPNLELRAARPDTAFPVSGTQTGRQGPAPPGLCEVPLQGTKAFLQASPLLPSSAQGQQGLCGGSVLPGGGRPPPPAPLPDTFPWMFCLMLWGVRAAKPGDRDPATSITVGQ